MNQLIHNSTNQGMIHGSPTNQAGRQLFDRPMNQLISSTPSIKDCEVDAGWKSLTLASLKSCYKEHNKALSWDDASQQCIKDGGSLASILSDDEQTMVSQVCTYVKSK